MVQQTRRVRLQRMLEFKKQALEKAQKAYLALLDGGVESYTIGSRSLTKLDLDKLSSEIDQLERDIDSLEAQLGGGAARKSVGIVLTDW